MNIIIGQKYMYAIMLFKLIKTKKSSLKLYHINLNLFNSIKAYTFAT